jgi:hypothetical protein
MAAGFTGGELVLLSHIFRARYFIRISKDCNFNQENDLKFKMN